MNRSIYEMLTEAAHMADVIEAAESGYVALSDADILKLDIMLLEMIENAQRAQKMKVPGCESA